jgi:hypothetical protein
MSADLPEYYFRIRENGAAVFLVDTNNRQRRIDLEEIATVNVKNGQVKPHGERVLTPRDIKAITNWLQERVDLLAMRDVDDILRSIDHLNMTAQWAQSKATDEQLDAVMDPLLLAMHDLRAVLVRKKAERLSRNEAAE